MRLRSARRAAGLTQVEVAKAFRNTQTFISKCERGERLVNALDLFDFAELYGVPVSSLDPGRDDQPGASAGTVSGQRLRVAEPHLRPGEDKPGGAKQDAAETGTSGRSGPKRGATPRTRRARAAGGSGSGRKKSGRPQPGRVGAPKNHARKAQSGKGPSSEPRKATSRKKGSRKRKPPREGSK